MWMDLSLDFPLCVLFPDERERDMKRTIEKKNTETKNNISQASKNVLSLTKNFAIRKIKYLPMQRRKQTKVIYHHLAK
jgi:hypothetical protein